MSELQPKTPVNDSPIDAVVTWVDGNDPAHRAKREEALRKLGKAGSGSGTIPAGKDPTRFTDNGEIRWCLHSLRKFAPWIRYIHLVTDNQVPKFLTPEKQKELGVRIVDHTEIFRGYEWALPTFNAYAIETVIWRIRGLSERFIFFNDDFMLLKSVQPSHFFADGKVVLRGAWQRVRGISPLHLAANRVLNTVLNHVFGISRTMQLYAQMNAARMLGHTRRYYRLPHIPHPLLKTTFADYFEAHEGSLNQNIRSRFRAITDYVPASLANHLEIQMERAKFVHYLDTSMFSAEYINKEPAKEIFEYVAKDSSTFLCLQSFDRYPESERIEIAKGMDRLLTE